MVGASFSGFDDLDGLASESVEGFFNFRGLLGDV